VKVAFVRPATSRVSSQRLCGRTQRWIRFMDRHEPAIYHEVSV